MPPSHFLQAPGLTEQSAVECLRTRSEQVAFMPKQGQCDLLAVRQVWHPRPQRATIYPLSIHRDHLVSQRNRSLLRRIQTPENMLHGLFIRKIKPVPELGLWFIVAIWL